MSSIKERPSYYASANVQSLNPLVGDIAWQIGGYPSRSRQRIGTVSGHRRDWRQCLYRWRRRSRRFTLKGIVGAEVSHLRLSTARGLSVRFPYNVMSCSVINASEGSGSKFVLNKNTRSETYE